MKTLSIIGGGNMGTAILQCVRKAFKVIVCEQDNERAQTLRRKYKVTLADFETAVKKADIVLIAVKPQNIDGVLECMSALIGKKLVVSIAAGITTSYIEKKLGNGTRVVRTMPNLPAQIGEGITAICGGGAVKSTDLKLAQSIFNCVGKTIVVDENLIDGVTAVSGSGPAYVFLFAECLINAATALGFSDKSAKELVYQTLLGSVHLLTESKDSASQLRARVTSKGGTTQAATDVFTAHNIEKIFTEALHAARKRAGELAK